MEEVTTVSRLACIKLLLYIKVFCDYAIVESALGQLIATSSLPCQYETLIGSVMKWFLNKPQLIQPEGV